jgi:hypothetical protein
MKTFKSFYTTSCYVVENRVNGLCKPFVLRKDAIEYWDMLEQKSEEPKLHTTTINDLHTWLLESQIQEFLNNNKNMYMLEETVSGDMAGLGQKIGDSDELYTILINKYTKIKDVQKDPYFKSLPSEYQERILRELEK